MPARAVRLMDKSLKELTPSEYKAVVQLNMGSRGLMRRTVQRCRKDHPQETRVIALVDERGKIVSWALLFPPDYGKLPLYYD